MKAHKIQTIGGVKDNILKKREYFDAQVPGIQWYIGGDEWVGVFRVR